MAADMPRSIRHAILSKPSEFLSSIAAILRRPAIYLTLVDKQHRLPTGYEPRDLVHLSRYGLSIDRKSLKLRKSIMPEVQAMVRAARADHVVLLFSSTYRSFATQKFVYDREVRLYGKTVADRESAVPGHSQHQMGTTIDFGCICNDFANTAAFKWLERHAWKYGFSMTYPKGFEGVTGYRYEPWHWHYITTAGTSAQREFFDNIQQYLLLFINENQALLVSSYRGANFGPGWNPGA
jgi:D-alanyl-D-alanine carboxypeptidase